MTPSTCLSFGVETQGQPDGFVFVAGRPSCDKRESADKGRAGRRAGLEAVGGVACFLAEGMKSRNAGEMNLNTAHEQSSIPMRIEEKNPRK